MQPSPSDKTLAPGANRQAAKSYKTDSKCQYRDISSGNRPTDVSQELTSLYERYVSDPSDDNERQLVETSVRHLEKSVHRIVHCKQGVAPSFLAPNTFAEDACNLVQAKFGIAMRRRRNIRNFAAWFRRIPKSAAFEERRQITRRIERGPRRGPQHWQPIELPTPDGMVIQVLDDEKNRHAAECWGDLSFNRGTGGKQLEHREIIRKLLHRLNISHDRREREASKWWRLIYEHGATVKEIAKLRGTTEGAVRALLAAGRRRMRQIAEQEYGLFAQGL